MGVRGRGGRRREKKEVGVEDGERRKWGRKRGKKRSWRRREYGSGG